MMRLQEKKASSREQRRCVKRRGESEGFPTEALDKTRKAYRNTTVYVADLIIYNIHWGHSWSCYELEHHYLLSHNEILSCRGEG